MIAQLTGVVTRSEGSAVVLDVGGVGYLVHVPAPLLSILPRSEGPVTLLTHLVVREDEMSLYGFSRPLELQVFRALLGVTGVGPKVGLALLSALDVVELAGALSSNDTKAVTRVPGVGPKLAQRLCLELGDRMASLAFEQAIDRSTASERTSQENSAFEDAIEGLVSLGYSRTDSRKAVDRVFLETQDRSDPGQLVNAAMRLLTFGIGR